jgi:hypothetical protein
LTGAVTEQSAALQPALVRGRGLADTLRGMEITRRVKELLEEWLEIIPQSLRASRPRRGFWRVWPQCYNSRGNLPNS